MGTSDLRAETPERTTSAGRGLRRVKILHTGIWALFATCTAAIPVLALVNQDRAAIALIFAVLARHNKIIFGLMYLAGVGMTFWRWAGQ